jgi:hypothetical protein
MPISWHVPSEVEWSTLLTNLGGESIAAVDLKEAVQNTGIIQHRQPMKQVLLLCPGARNNNIIFNQSALRNWWSVSESIPRMHIFTP